MRKLVYLIASTIDGFIADPGGHDPSGPDGFLRADQDYLEHLISEYPETLPGQLRPEIDELVVKLHPVAVGSGVPLFDGAFRPFRFRLTGSHISPSGVLFLTYASAGG